MVFFYNLLLKLATLGLLPVVPLLLPFWPSLRRGLKTRLGFPSRALREGLGDLPRPRVWFHAASVGELSAVAPIVTALKRRLPEANILISCATLNGLALARERIPEAAAAFLLPLDYPGAVRRMLHWVEPDLLVIAETEIWPNLLLQARRRHCQLALVNGRMSESSFRRYRRIRGLIQPALQAFDLLALQSEKDAERFRALGSNAQRLKVTGNVKFDGAGGKDLEALRAELRLGADQPVWVAGSTRPGEEEIVLEAFTAVHAEYPEAVLVLAPRHLERLREVQKLLAARQWTFTRRSRIASELLNFPVILLDTMGELARVYALGRVAFVGGTLVPLGGHNPLEPAIQGVPVLMGPHYEHFAKVTDILKAGGGAQIVHSAQELANAVLGLLRDPDQARARGKRARQAVLDHQGAAAHTAELLQKLMLIRRWGSEVSNWRQETTASGATDMVVSKDTLLEDWPEWPL